MCLCFVHEGKERKYKQAGCEAISSEGVAMVSTTLPNGENQCWCKLESGGIQRLCGCCCERLASRAIMVEAMAVLEGCLLARQCNYHQIMVESGCKQILSYLNGDLDDCNWEIYPLLSRILQTRCLFQNCVWSWVPRSTNEAGNFVAKFIGTKMSNSVWVDRPPIFVDGNLEQKWAAMSFS